MRTLILAVALSSSILPQADTAASLSAARDLYASADYRGALEMLDRLADGHASSQDSQSIDLYRAFCLIALGRTNDADEAIAAMITRDPLSRPAASEIPPRLRPMFSDKRKAMLPAIIQSKYDEAKGSYDQRDYKTAAEGFTDVLRALTDSDIAGPASRPPLSDLRVLHRLQGFGDSSPDASSDSCIASSDGRGPGNENSRSLARGSANTPTDPRQQ